MKKILMCCVVLAVAVAGITGLSLTVYTTPDCAAGTALSGGFTDLVSGENRCYIYPANGMVELVCLEYPQVWVRSGCSYSGSNCPTEPNPATCAFNVTVDTESCHFQQSAGGNNYYYKPSGCLPPPPLTTPSATVPATAPVPEPSPDSAQPEPSTQPDSSSEPQTASQPSPSSGLPPASPIDVVPSTPTVPTPTGRSNHLKLSSLLVFLGLCAACLGL